MNDDDVNAVLGPLVVAFAFTNELADLWDEKLHALVDLEAAGRSRDAIIDDAESRRPPAWGEFKKLYDRWFTRLEEERAERRLALEAGPQRLNLVTPKEGRQIAASAYAKAYRRRPPPNIFAYVDGETLPAPNDDDVATALTVLRAGTAHEGRLFSRYTEVLHALGGHQSAARAAVGALERSGRVHHHPNGVLILLAEH